nr:MAG TPA: hypothetical protein [Caudoviricetes sp.]
MLSPALLALELLILGLPMTSHSEPEDTEAQEP